MKKNTNMKVLSFRFWSFLAGLGLVVCGGTLAFAVVEHFPLVDAFYFTVVTITTVGFGDLHPATPLGKILAVILILTGVGIFTAMVASAADMILSKRETQQRLEKLNMVIGAFYSEVGTRLLVNFSDCDPQLELIRHDLLTATRCPDEDFRPINAKLRAYEYAVDIEKVDLAHLRSLLAGKRGFLLRLVENPTLLEHEAFTDLLMAVFHLTEELIHREEIRDLPETDMVHISGDIKRVYGMLVDQWLDYMRYLKVNYPYLFSLAMRTNPFDQGATPVVK